MAPNHSVSLGKLGATLFRAVMSQMGSAIDHLSNFSMPPSVSERLAKLHPMKNGATGITLGHTKQSCALIDWGNITCIRADYGY